jgi:tRNA threonylcarbamoyladenosine biosynthesis protein TsaE
MLPRTSAPAAPSAAVRVLISRSADETHRLAARLADAARAGDVVALVGELGAGKTVFAKGFAAGLGVSATVNSPSFVLMSEYAGRLPLFPLDLFRLADATEAFAGGLLDERQAGGVTLIEWADRLGPALPIDRLDVRIDGTGDEPRTIGLTAGGPEHRRYLEAIDR